MDSCLAVAFRWGLCGRWEMLGVGFAGRSVEVGSLIYIFKDDGLGGWVMLGRQWFDLERERK